MASAHDPSNRDAPQFLTVEALGGRRVVVNLDLVTQLVETEGGTAVLFANGAVLQTRQDFAALDLRTSTEIVPLPPVPPPAAARRDALYELQLVGGRE